MKKIMIICLPILLFYGTLSAQGAGKALYFDTTFEYVKCLNSTSLNPSNITLETWLNPASVSAGYDKCFIDKRNGGGYHLRHYNKGISFRLVGDTYTLSVGDVLTANEWQHVAATYDGTDMKIYHNGKLVAGPKNIGSISFSNTHYLSLGAIAWTSWSSDFCFNGIMDEIRIWDTALTQSQIQEMMNKKIYSNNLASGLAWTNLNAYWRFDDGADPTDDYSENNNTGNLISGPAYQTSTAPIGDASHIGTGTSNLTESADVPVDITWDASGDPGGSAIFSAIQVNEAPDVTTGLLAHHPATYWELWIAYEDAAYQADVSFHYDNIGGISNESNLKLYTRSNAGNSWSEVSGFTINDEGNNTDGIGSITANNLTSFSQFILTSADNTLSVILSSLTAQYLNNTPTLYWETQSETDNMGWFIYRNEEEDFTSAEKISELIEGHGTTSQMQSYIYEDRIQNPEVGDKYYYWLESIDYSGIVNYYDRVAVLTIPYHDEPGSGSVTIPEQYGLFQNEPNPVTSSTNISFNLPSTAHVDLTVYNINGQLVKILYSGIASYKTVQWDGKDEFGKAQKNGIYLYKLEVNGKLHEIKKMILMR